MVNRLGARTPVESTVQHVVWQSEFSSKVKPALDQTCDKQQRNVQYFSGLVDSGTLCQHRIADNHLLSKSKDPLIVCRDAQKRNKKDVEERLAEIEEALRIFSQRRVLVKTDDE